MKINVTQKHIYADAYSHKYATTQTHMGTKRLTIKTERGYVQASWRSGPSRVGEGGRPMITLARSIPSKNLHRFYAMHLAPTLFGEWVLIAE
jgi:hypothetical protein